MNPAKEARDALTNVWKYYDRLHREVYDEIKSNNPHIYIIDWDCIQHYAEFQLTRSVYAATAFMAFSKTKEAKQHLYVPSGTRKEFTDYLLDKLRSQRFGNLNTSGKMSVPNEGNEGVYKNEKFRIHERKLFESRHFEKALSLLDLFCRNFAAPLSSIADNRFPINDSSKIRSTEEYNIALKEIGREQRSGFIRNEADAANIATLDIAVAKGVKITLITATQMLAEIRPRNTADPIYLLLSMYFRSKYQEKGRLLDKLEIILERILKIKGDLRPWEGAFGVRGYRVSRFGLQKFQQQISEFRDDQVLGDSVKLLMDAHTDAKTKLELYQGKDRDEILVPEYQDTTSAEKSLSKVIVILAELYKGKDIELDDLGYQWEEAKIYEHFLKRALVRRIDRRVVLQIESNKSKDVIVLTWPTGITMEEFLNIASCDISEDYPADMLIYYSQRGTLSKASANKKDLQNYFRKCTKRIKPNGLRLIFPDKHVLYFSGDIACNESARVSTVLKTIKMSLFEKIYLASFIEFLEPKFIEKIVSESLKAQRI